MTGKKAFYKDFVLPLEDSHHLKIAGFDSSCSPIRDEAGLVLGLLLILVEKINIVKERRENFEELRVLSKKLEVSKKENETMIEEVSAASAQLNSAQHSLDRSERLFQNIALNVPKSIQYFLNIKIYTYIVR
ncbi:hypothetical protein [Chryseobacterium indoltheticum]|uniref:Uncharacterized protein n=1 Tax=Chryseobacterium indoltheticum TaxID=254 RepID=A0A381FHM5_9FLAO|nr:hypothetical protein [Chryseobacterium indoltheticum]SUX46040.1 Uncharacterised protein [Chryseobacterium indoltheticum]